MEGIKIRGKTVAKQLDMSVFYWTNKNADLAYRAVSASLLVEMGESRTPRPNKPIGECTTGLVDVLFNASDSHRQDSSALVLWS